MDQKSTMPWSPVLIREICGFNCAFQDQAHLLPDRTGGQERINEGSPKDLRGRPPRTPAWRSPVRSAQAKPGGVSGLGFFWLFADSSGWLKQLPNGLVSLRDSALPPVTCRCSVPRARVCRWRARHDLPVRPNQFRLTCGRPLEACGQTEFLRVTGVQVENRRSRSPTIIAQRYSTWWPYLQTRQPSRRLHLRRDERRECRLAKNQLTEKNERNWQDERTADRSAPFAHDRPARH